MANVPEAEGFDINAEYFKLKREGNQHFQNDELDKAMECFQKSMECVPGPPKEILEVLHVNLSTIYFKKGSWEKALEHVNLALEINPDDDRALFTKHRILDAAGKCAEALDVIASLCCLKIHDPFYMRALDFAVARVAELDGEELVKNRVPNPRSKFNVNTYFKSFTADEVAKWWRGDFPKGDEDLELVCQSLSKQSLKDASSDGQGDMKMGTKFSQGGFVAALADLVRHDYSKIMDHCTEELSKAESKLKAEAHLLRGTFRLLWGYSDVDVLEDLDPITSGSLPASTEQQTSAWIKRGELFTLTKNMAEVTKSYEEAQSLSPDSPDVYIAYSNSLMESEKLLEAYLQISKGVEKCPTSAYAAAACCLLKFRVEKSHGYPLAPLEAINSFRARIAQFPQSPEVHIAFAYFFKEIDETCASYMEFQRACELDPENFHLASIKIMMGFETTGHLETCLKELKELLAKDDTNICVYEALAAIYISTEPNFDLALEAVEKGIQVSKSRHDFLSFAILKKTIEIRKKVVASVDSNHDPTNDNLRFDQFLLDACSSPLD